MEFDPKIYDQSNYDTLLPAKQLIKVINGIKMNKKLSVVLDIGCGTGNMTKLLSQQIDCDHAVGCDIDPKMIEFAKSNNSSSNIEYVVQDISTDWKLFNKKLQELYGKVCVVTSNFSLTWVKDIATAAQNICNLLSIDGIAVLNIVYDGDIFKMLPNEDRNQVEKLLKYPSEQELIGNWIVALKSVGLNRIDTHYYEPKVMISEKTYTEDYINIPINWYKSFTNPKNGNNLIIDKLLKRLLIEDRCKKLDLTSRDEEQQVEITNYIWQIVAQKV